MESITNHQTKLYGNWLVLSPDGQEMFRTSEKRANWYLKRNLAEVVDTKTVKLLFSPGGPGERDDAPEFYLAPKENVCVVCGSTESLTRHHVVPHMYRKHFPIELKSRSSHDVLLICIDDHERYEHHAHQLKQSLLEEKLGKPLTASVRQQLALKSWARALLQQVHPLPEERRQELTALLTAELNVEPTLEELQRLSSTKIEQVGPDGPTAGLVTLRRFKGTVNEFCALWREHFVKHTQPRFLPVGWRTDYLLADDGVTFVGIGGDVSGSLDDRGALDHGV